MASISAIRGSQAAAHRGLPEPYRDGGAGHVFNLNATSWRTSDIFCRIVIWSTSRMELPEWSTGRNRQQSARREWLGADHWAAVDRPEAHQKTDKPSGPIAEQLGRVIAAGGAFGDLAKGRVRGDELSHGADLDAVGEGEHPGVNQLLPARRRWSPLDPAAPIDQHFGEPARVALRLGAIVLLERPPQGLEPRRHAPWPALPSARRGRARGSVYVTQGTARSSTLAGSLNRMFFSTTLAWCAATWVN